LGACGKMGQQKKKAHLDLTIKVHVTKVGGKGKGLKSRDHGLAKVRLCLRDWTPNEG